MKPDDLAPLAYRPNRNARFVGSTPAPVCTGIYYAALIMGLTLLAIVTLIAVWRLTFPASAVSPAPTQTAAPIHSHPTTELRPALGKDSR